MRSKACSFPTDIQPMFASPEEIRMAWQGSQNDRAQQDVPADARMHRRQWAAGRSLSIEHFSTSKQMSYCMVRGIHNSSEYPRYWGWLPQELRKGRRCNALPVHVKLKAAIFALTAAYFHSPQRQVPCQLHVRA